MCQSLNMISFLHLLYCQAKNPISPKCESKTFLLNSGQKEDNFAWLANSEAFEEVSACNKLASLPGSVLLWLPHTKWCKTPKQSVPISSNRSEKKNHIKLWIIQHNIQQRQNMTRLHTLIEWLKAENVQIEPLSESRTLKDEGWRSDKGQWMEEHQKH